MASKDLPHVSKLKMAVTKSFPSSVATAQLGSARLGLAWLDQNRSSQAEPFPNEPAQAQLSWLEPTFLSE